MLAKVVYSLSTEKFGYDGLDLWIKDLYASVRICDYDEKVCGEGVEEDLGRIWKRP